SQVVMTLLRVVDVRRSRRRRGFYSGNSPTIKRMPQKNRTVKGVLGGLLGLVGLSAVAGVLATAAVTPAIAIAGVSGSQALSIFEDLPNSLTPGAPMEPTVFYATGEDGKQFQLAKFYDQNRVPVTFDQVSPLLFDAV